MMKNKLKRIKIEGSDYVYTVTSQYHAETSTNTLTVRIFLNGKKQTPLIIQFLTIDHYYMGQLLNSGVYLRNNQTHTEELVNINKPKYIRELILQGEKKGWTGLNRIGVQNGLDYLIESGYEIQSLLPPVYQKRL